MFLADFSTKSLNFTPKYLSETRKYWTQAWWYLQSESNECNHLHYPILCEDESEFSESDINWKVSIRTRLPSLIVKPLRQMDVLKGVSILKETFYGIKVCDKLNGDYYSFAYCFFNFFSTIVIIGKAKLMMFLNYIVTIKVPN